MKTRSRDLRDRATALADGARRAAVRRARLQERHGARHLPGGARQRRGRQLSLRRQARALPRGAAGRRSTRCARRTRPRAAGRPRDSRRRSSCGAIIVVFLQPGARSGTRHRPPPDSARDRHDPTPALDALVEQGIRPRLEYLGARGRGAHRLRPRRSRACSAAVASIQAQTIIWVRRIRSPNASDSSSSRRRTTSTWPHDTSPTSRSRACRADRGAAAIAPDRERRWKRRVPVTSVSRL